MVEFKAKLTSAKPTMHIDDGKRLVDENTSLKEQNQSLKSEIHKLEEERNSLMLALRLVSAGQPQPEQISQSPLTSQPTKLASRNKNDTLKATEEEPNPSQNRQVTNSSTKKPITVIVGDSMVKNVRGWDLSNASNKVIVKSFSGATTEDMEDYIRPVLRKEPDKLILHVGTNDLKTLEPTEIVNSIQSLAINIEENSPNTCVSISAVLPRKESQPSKNISSINNSLKLICDQHQ